MQENPHVQKISIEGHASDEGDENYNLTLSKARAEAVRAYLVGKGVEPIDSARRATASPSRWSPTTRGRIARRTGASSSTSPSRT